MTNKKTGEESSCRDGEEQSRQGVRARGNSLSSGTRRISNTTFDFHWWSAIRRLPVMHLESDLKYYRNFLVGAILEFIDLACWNESQLLMCSLLENNFFLSWQYLLESPLAKSSFMHVLMSSLHGN